MIWFFILLSCFICFVIGVILGCCAMVDLHVIKPQVYVPRVHKDRFVFPGVNDK